MKLENISMDEYDYALPLDKIAQYPLPKRDASKLLIYKEGKIEDNIFSNLSDFIPANSLLIFNNTKVIHARLFFKHNQHVLEVFCLEPISPEILPEKALSVKHQCIWACMIGNARKWKEGMLSMDVIINDTLYILNATRGNVDDNAYNITFEWEGDITFGDIIAAAGAMPLPPYIKRTPDNNDESRYQTIYAQHNGSVAAPTAGLHFTNEVFASLLEKRIKKAQVTLHVGAGTFKPVKANDIQNHTMHEEIFSVDIETLKILANSINDCVAVGTTSLRTIESVYWCGVRIINGDDNPLFVPQWYAYNNPSSITYYNAVAAIINYLSIQGQDVLVAKTALLCMPGYKFHGIKAIITNFHQPRSTLILLVSAFVGGHWKKIYDYALKNEFRFLSYGDGSLLYRSQIE